MIRFAPVAAALLLATAAVAAGPANPDPKAVAAGTYTVETSHARVQFTVSHMGFSDWYGDFSGITGTLVLDPANPAASKVEVTIPVASVMTTNTTLDEHLRSADWLDAAAFPTITFKSTKVDRTAPTKAKITGNLTLHGVTRPVVLDAVLLGSGANPMSKAVTVGFNATTTIKRSDFGVKSYVPMIGDETAIRISVPFEKAK